MFVGINPKRFSKEGFSFLVHEFFVLAQSIFFGIFTHGHDFRLGRRVPFNFRCTCILQLRDTNAKMAKIGQEGSTVAPTSSPKQCLKSLEFPKQLLVVFTQIQGDISCKLDMNFRLPGI